MDMDDKELFDSATSDEPIPEVAEAAPAEAQPEPQTDGRARDEHGRFAPKQAEPAAQQAAPQAQAPVVDDNAAQVPSWRLREIREESERRIAETEARYRRELEEVRRQAQPKPEPTPAPDMFENPNGFVDHHLRQGLTPIEQQQQQLRAELQETREFYSRRDAEKEHGPEAVRASYDWLADGVRRRDPDVLHTYYQAMQSKHPFDAIVQAHRRVDVMQQIGNDPDAWVMKRYAELQAAKSPQTAPQSQSRTPQGSIVKLPPSLRNAPASQSASGDDDNDMSDAALFRHASR